MDYLKVGKIVIGLIAGIGADKIVGNVVRATTPAAVGKLARGAIWVGGAFMGMMVGDKVGEYSGELIDKTVEQTKKLMEEIENKKMEKSKA
jgi:hypothetical protein